MKEVSLVDKAANKRKFLFAKREDEFSQPEEALVVLKENFAVVLDLLKGASHNENPKLGELAKEVLINGALPLVSFLSPADREQLAKQIKGDPAPAGTQTTEKTDVSKDGAAGKETETQLELTPEQMKMLADTVDTLDKDIKELQAQ